ncbi:MAG: ferrous iron transport protein A [Myxococcota bacterium]
MTLQELPVGEEAVVSDVEGQRGVRRRLLEMGLLPGTTVRVVRRAPLGDPLELQLRGYSLSIRGEDAKGVSLTKGAG